MFSNMIVNTKHPFSLIQYVTEYYCIINIPVYSRRSLNELLHQNGSWLKVIYDSGIYIFMEGNRERWNGNHKFL